ncbi:leucine-rich repeat and guanylate kinase domain-containing protein isoform X2 [Silurus meridionalis]|nr:leucine-rich repeat and guanylate kinase domain-containing protein isoform X2 [Silurus meridionalis]
MDAFKATPSRQDSRLAMYGKTLHIPVLGFTKASPGAAHALTPPPVTIKRGKGKRVNHSAELTYTHSKAPVVLSPVGDPVAPNNRSAAGFPVDFSCRNDNPVILDRLDFDRIQRVCGLDSLKKLDVLDLHKNQINRIENVSHLEELRVLNLAGNCISRVENLQGLESLIELDLRHNRITSVLFRCTRHQLEHLCCVSISSAFSAPLILLPSFSPSSSPAPCSHPSPSEQPQQALCASVFLHVRMRVRWPDGAVCRHCKVTGRMTEVDQLPSLQRLFLSGNSISSFDDLACLGDSCSLSELTLDGNPVAQESCYKQTALRCVLPLRLLDMKRITEEDRRAANLLARKEDEKKRESHKQAAHKEKRRLAIRNAAQQWEESRSFLELPAQNGSKEELSPENTPAHSPGQTNGIAQEHSPDDLRRDRGSPLTVPERPAGGSDTKLRSNSRPNSPRDPKLQEAGGASVQSLSLSESHVAELDGETVRLFGPGALDTLERGWGVQTASAVNIIAFRYIQFDSIVPMLPRIRLKFPNLTHLIFMETNITRLLQLAALAQVKRLEQVTIDPEGNPVVSLTLWRSFIIYRLNHLNLQRINGTEVTMNDVMAAERIFGTLGHVASTETPHCRLLLLLEESRKRQLQFLLEGRVRRFGLSPEELRENGKLLGESMSRALFNYHSKDSSSESPEESSSEVLERSSAVDQYLRGLAHAVSSTSVKREAFHKLWPTMFVEMVRDCVLKTRDAAACARTCLDTLSDAK